MGGARRPRCPCRKDVRASAVERPRPLVRAKAVRGSGGRTNKEKEVGARGSEKREGDACVLWSDVWRHNDRWTTAVGPIFDVRSFPQTERKQNHPGDLRDGKEGHTRGRVRAPITGLPYQRACEWNSHDRQLRVQRSEHGGDAVGGGEGGDTSNEKPAASAINERRAFRHLHPFGVSNADVPRSSRRVRVGLPRSIRLTRLGAVSVRSHRCAHGLGGEHRWLRGSHVNWAPVRGLGVDHGSVCFGLDEAILFETVHFLLEIVLFGPASTDLHIDGRPSGRRRWRQL